MNLIETLLQAMVAKQERYNSELQAMVAKQDQILVLLQEEKNQKYGAKSQEKTKNVTMPTWDQNQKKVVNTSFGQKHLDIANEIYRIINATVKTKQPNMSVWANDIRKIDKIDKIPVDNILKVFKVANKDDFWSMNIRSPKKLRKHWDRLHLVFLKSQGLNSKKTDKRESLDYFKEQQW